MRLKKINRFISSFLILCFSFTEILRAAPEVSLNSLWGSSGMDGGFAFKLPSDLGRIDHVYIPNVRNHPLKVIHIKTAHGIYAASKQLEKTIGFLSEKYGIKTVYVEGASESLWPELIRFFPDKKSNLELADRLAQEGWLTGVELGILQAREKIESFGIEDAALYRKAYGKFKSVLEKFSAIENALAKRKQILDREASKIFDSTTRKTFQSWIKFEKNEIDLPGLLRELENEALNRLQIDLNNPFEQFAWPHLVRMSLLRQLENRMSVSAFEKELQEATREFGENKIKALVNVLREKQPESPRDSLEEFFQKTGFAFERYPQLTYKAAYQVLHNEIDAEFLFDEIRRLFKKLMGAGIVRKDQKELIRKYEEWLLLSKLGRLELTREEWDSLPRTGMKKASWVKSALEFYHLAEERETVFLRKLIESSNANNDKPVLIVTGGFHTKGMQALFEKNSIAYALLTPRLENLEGNTYHQIMLGKSCLEQTPLLYPAASSLRQGWDIHAQAKAVFRHYRELAQNLPPPKQTELWSNSPYAKDRVGHLSDWNPRHPPFQNLQKTANRSEVRSQVSRRGFLKQATLAFGVTVTAPAAILAQEKAGSKPEDVDPGSFSSKNLLFTNSANERRRIEEWRRRDVNPDPVPVGNFDSTEWQRLRETSLRNPVDPELFRTLTENDPLGRANLIKAWGLSGDSRVLPVLIQAAGDPHWTVRMIAAWALAQFRYSETNLREFQDARFTVLFRLAQDESFYVRANAARALSALVSPSGTADRRAVETLSNLFTDPHIYVSVSAVESAGQIRDPRLFEPLLLLLDAQEKLFPTRHQIDFSDWSLMKTAFPIPAIWEAVPNALYEIRQAHPDHEGITSALHVKAVQLLSTGNSEEAGYYYAVIRALLRGQKPYAKHGLASLPAAFMSSLLIARGLGALQHSTGGHSHGFSGKSHAEHPITATPLQNSQQQKGPFKKWLDVNFWTPFGKFMTFMTMVMLFVTGGYAYIEYAFSYGSLILLGDAFHMALHVVAGIVAGGVMLLNWWKQAESVDRDGNTVWDLRGVTINGATLVVIAIVMIMEGLAKLFMPFPLVAGTQILTITLIGLGINVLSILATHFGLDGDLNTEFFKKHIWADLFDSVAIIGGIISMQYFDLPMIDAFLVLLFGIHFMKDGIYGFKKGIKGLRAIKQNQAGQASVSGEHRHEHGESCKGGECGHNAPAGLVQIGELSKKTNPLAALTEFPKANHADCSHGGCGHKHEKPLTAFVKLGILGALSFWLVSAHLSNKPAPASSEQAAAKTSGAAAPKPVSPVAINKNIPDLPFEQAKHALLAKAGDLEKLSPALQLEVAGLAPKFAKFDAEQREIETDISQLQTEIKKIKGTETDLENELKTLLPQLEAAQASYARVQKLVTSGAATRAELEKRRSVYESLAAKEMQYKAKIAFTPVHIQEIEKQIAQHWAKSKSIAGQRAALEFERIQIYLKYARDNNNTDFAFRMAVYIYIAENHPGYAYRPLIQALEGLDEQYPNPWANETQNERYQQTAAILIHTIHTAAVRNSEKGYETKTLLQPVVDVWQKRREDGKIHASDPYFQELSRRVFGYELQLPYEAQGANRSELRSRTQRTRLGAEVLESRLTPSTFGMETAFDFAPIPDPLNTEPVAAIVQAMETGRASTNEVGALFGSGIFVGKAPAPDAIDFRMTGRAVEIPFALQKKIESFISQFQIAERGLSSASLSLPEEQKIEFIKTLEQIETVLRNQGIRDLNQLEWIFSGKTQAGISFEKRLSWQEVKQQIQTTGAILLTRLAGKIQALEIEVHFARGNLTQPVPISDFQFDLDIHSSIRPGRLSFGDFANPEDVDAGAVDAIFQSGVAVFDFSLPPSLNDFFSGGSMTRKPENPDQLRIVPTPSVDYPYGLNPDEELPPAQDPEPIAPAAPLGESLTPLEVQPPSELLIPHDWLKVTAANPAIEASQFSEPVGERPEWFRNWSWLPAVVFIPIAVFALVKSSKKAGGSFSHRLVSLLFSAATLFFLLLIPYAWLPKNDPFVREVEDSLASPKETLRAKNSSQKNRFLTQYEAHSPKLVEEIRKHSGVVIAVEDNSSYDQVVIEVSGLNERGISKSVALIEISKKNKRWALSVWGADGKVLKDHRVEIVNDPLDYPNQTAAYLPIGQLREWLGPETKGVYFRVALVGDVASPQSPISISDLGSKMDGVKNPMLEPRLQITLKQFQKGEKGTVLKISDKEMEGSSQQTHESKKSMKDLKQMSLNRHEALMELLNQGRVLNVETAVAFFQKDAEKFGNPSKATVGRQLSELSSASRIYNNDSRYPKGYYYFVSGALNGVSHHEENVEGIDTDRLFIAAQEGLAYQQATESKHWKVVFRSELRQAPVQVTAFDLMGVAQAVPVSAAGLLVIPFSLALNLGGIGRPDWNRRTRSGYRQYMEGALRMRLLGNEKGAEAQAKMTALNDASQDGFNLPVRVQSSTAQKPVVIQFISRALSVKDKSLLLARLQNLPHGSVLIEYTRQGERSVLAAEMRRFSHLFYVRKAYVEKLSLTVIKRELFRVQRSIAKNNASASNSNAGFLLTGFEDLKSGEAGELKDLGLVFMLNNEMVQGFAPLMRDSIRAAVFGRFIEYVQLNHEVRNPYLQQEVREGYLGMDGSFFSIKNLWVELRVKSHLATQA